VRATVESSPAAAAELGNVVRQFGTDIVQEEQRKADEIAVMSARRRLTEFENSTLYDPKTGALNRKGRDSFGLPEQINPEFDKQVTQIESELNDRQKRVFRRIAEESRSRLDTTVQRHVFQERQKYDTDETNNFVKTERDSAVFNYLDPRRVEASIENQIVAINAYASRNGRGAEWTKSEVENARSKTYLGIIKRALAEGKDQYASAFYEEVKNDIKSDESIEAAKLVSDGKYMGQSQRTADAIITKFGMSDLNVLYEQVKTIEDPKLRDQVQVRIDAEVSRYEHAVRATREVNFREAEKLVLSGRAVPPTIFQNLTVSQATAIRQYQKVISKGDSPETDWSLWYDLMGRASSDDPTVTSKFVKEDLLQYRAKLSDNEFKGIVAIQKSIRSKDNKETDKITGFRTTKQIVDDALSSSGLDPTPKYGTTDAKNVAKFRSMVDTLIMDFEVRERRKPNTKDIQGMVDDLLMKGEVPGTGFFFNTKKRAFELDPAKGETVVITKITDVPITERRKIEDALKRNGYQVTDDEIMKRYSQKLNLTFQRARQ
jgi:hypothetical protein